jgi:MATE family multidrug resistance protein
LTDAEAIVREATRMLPWTAAYVFASPLAFQLDGVFIGATRTAALRNASALSALCFVAFTFPLIDGWENAGLWAAFVAYVLLRGLSLLAALPALRRTLPSNEEVFAS